MSILEVSDLKVHYGDMVALHGVSISVKEKEIVTILGANAAGKSTLLNTIAGLTPPASGTMRFAGEVIDNLAPHERVERGLIMVPEGRMVFPFLSVEDNLELGAFARRARESYRTSLARVFEMFPRLVERRKQMAGSLSGGEQSMLALSRGLMAQPRLLLLDEPSLGLSPLLVHEVMAQVEKIRDDGVTILIVEQNVHHTLRFADRGYVLENGQVALTGTAASLRESAEIRRAYLGM